MHVSLTQHVGVVMLLLLLVVVNLVACSFMAGLIWYVQVVHYPLFKVVGLPNFSDYHDAHVKRTGWVVILPMLVEIVSAFAIFALTPLGLNKSVAFTGLLLLGLIWGSTFLAQVPAHEKLSEEFTVEAWQRLVQSNWLRTVGWSLRVPLAGWMLHAIVTAPIS